MNTTLKHIGTVVEWAIFIALIPLFFIIVSPLLPTKDYLTTYAVVTGSMEPTVPVGTLALVSRNWADDLGPGDIIAFPEPSNPERIILHRITESLTDGNITEFKTKGDNNDAEDIWTVGESTVRGKMVYGLPYIGNIIMFARQPMGFALLVGIPAALLILLQVRTIKEGIEEEIERRTAQALQRKAKMNTAS
jgi:signal peptidase